MLKPGLTASVIGVLVCAVTCAGAQPAGPADPLFRAHEPLQVTMTAPFATLEKERSNEEYLPGTWSFTATGGDAVVLDIGVRTRGNYRRERRTCPFPPLRINFKKSQAKDTLFHKQDKLKLVTHCRDRNERYNQNVLRELIGYRILNELTDESFRVRMLRITYVDSDGKDKDREQFAFLIEDTGRLAKRLDKPELVTQSIGISQLDGPYSDLVSMFQFMIGNTDFSQIAGAEGEDCCHNSKLFGPPEGPVLSIPYDFDLAGLVNAPYATPNPRFKLRNVKQRLYRGICDFNVHLDDTLKAFRDNEDAIDALIRSQPGLDDRNRKQLLGYVDEFYELIADPRMVDRYIRNRCR